MPYVHSGLNIHGVAIYFSDALNERYQTGNAALFPAIFRVIARRIEQDPFEVGRGNPGNLRAIGLDMCELEGNDRTLGDSFARGEYPILGGDIGEPDPTHRAWNPALLLGRVSLRALRGGERRAYIYVSSSWWTGSNQPFRYSNPSYNATRQYVETYDHNGGAFLEILFDQYYFFLGLYWR